MSAIAQKSFAGGEIAPSLYARTDISKYGIGLRTCRNMMVMRHGGVTNRPGTTWIGEVKDSTKTVRLIPFVFSTDQTYVLEFGNLYMRVIRAGAYVTETAQAITGITNAATAVLTYSGADNYANGDQVYITGVVGAIAPFVNGRTFKVANVNAGANTFELNYLNGTAVNSTTWGTWTSGGTIAEIYTIVTSYAEADLQDLIFAQSADSMILTHPTYPPQQLVRAGHASWSINNATFVGDLFVNMTGFTNSGAAGTATSWAVTVESHETGEETVVQLETTSSAAPTAGAPITLTVTMLGGAPSLFGVTTIWTFNLYRKLNGIYGYIGSAYGAASATFVDNGQTPDITDSPPEARNPFASADNYPACVAYYQNRRIYAGTNNHPETAFASMISVYTNYRNDFPIQDNFPVTWTMAGQQVNRIKHLLSMGKLLLFTTTAEWAILGNASGALTPADINPQQYSQNGASGLRPLVVSGDALYVQARGNVVRDLSFDFQSDGYKGNDLTILAAHLFDGYTIRDWSYQQVPHSIVWAVRSDGKLLGLTYIREQDIFAWHRHDFQDATVEQICVVPEGTEDAVYLVIKRTVNSATVRYVERLSTRNFSAITDAIFMDAALSYTGTNSGATTMTLSGGTLWDAYEDLTLTASAGFFTAADVGNRIDITSATGAVIRCTITQFTSTTVVTVHANKNVPANLQSTARATWTKCVLSVSGLWHLEGKSVSVIGDGFVVASPNNSPSDGSDGYPTITVANGVATFPKPYGIVHVGLPILADIETLDIDVSTGESLSNKKKMINEVTAFVQATRGMFAGVKPPTDDSDDPVEGLDELKIRDEEGYDDPVSLTTDNVKIILSGEWNGNGRVFIRQVDPLPITLLSVVPTGFVPYSGGA